MQVIIYVNSARVADELCRALQDRAYKLGERADYYDDLLARFEDQELPAEELAARRDELAVKIDAYTSAEEALLDIRSSIKEQTRHG